MATGQRQSSVYCGEEGLVGAINSIICAMHPEFVEGWHGTSAGSVGLYVVLAE